MPIKCQSKRINAFIFEYWMVIAHVALLRIEGVGRRCERMRISLKCGEQTNGRSYNPLQWNDDENSAAGQFSAHEHSIESID